MGKEIFLGRINPETGRFRHSSSRLEREPKTSIGSGFSGEVARASLGGKEVVVKRFRPPPEKLIIRDRLWALAAGEPYPLELNYHAVVHAARCWHLFSEIANRTLSPDLKVKVNPLIGFYYDHNDHTYAMVSPFVKGGPGQPEVRLLGHISSQDNFCQKMKVMAALAELAKEIGMADLARQFEKGTLISPANVLMKEDGQFVAVDVTPGLCVRWPLSPYDLLVFLKDVRKGQFGKRHFLNVDVRLLKSFFIVHLELTDLWPIAKSLTASYSETQNSFPAVWEARNYISAKEKQRLEEKNWPFYFWLAKYLPILELGRKNNRDLLKIAWVQEQTRKGRLSLLMAEAIAQSDRKLIEYFLLRRPVEMARNLIKDFLIAPARIIAGDRRFFRSWFLSMGVDIGAAAKEPYETIKIKNDFRDLVAMVALESFFKAGSIGIISAIDYRLGLIAAVMETPFLPIPLPSPAGLLRMIYLNLRSLTDLPEVVRSQSGVRNRVITSLNYLGERFAWSLPASLKTWGNFALLIKLYTTHPRETLAVTRHLVNEIVGKVPVFGEPSGVLQQYVFDLVFNLPHTLIASLVNKLQRKKV